MADNAVSGKTGTVKSGGTDIAHITNWKLTRSSNNHAFASNQTSGFKARVAGVKDFNGSFEAKIKTTSGPALTEGAEVTLELHLDDSGSNFYSCPVIIDSVDLEVDIDEGAPIAYTCNFSGDGAYTTNGIAV